MKSFTNYREAMKKFIILLSAVALFASCQEVIENPNQPEAAVSKVPMVLESVITKTVLADDGLSIHWETGDVFSVFDNLGNNEKFTTTDAGASARFEGSVLSTANDFYAMVPYRTTNTTFDYENRTLRTYLDELKSVAVFYGIFPEEIDQLLEDGFTTDDIEELLYYG